MEAARIASLRGHKVTLFEKTGELGGAILYCCSVPGKHKMRWYADWLRRQMQNLGVEIRFRAEPDAEQLRNFDVVLVATGSRVTRPDVPGIDLPLVISYEDALRCGNVACEYYPKTGYCRPSVVKLCWCGVTILPLPIPPNASGTLVRRSTWLPRIATSPNGWNHAIAT